VIHERAYCHARRAAWFGFFAALFVSLTAPINDPDFWWHLASGKWMWENRSLLQMDPFSVPFGQAAASPDSGFVLKQYWLAQLIHYGVYALAGFKALVLLRACVYTLMFALLRRILAGTGAGELLCAVLLAASAEVVLREVPYVADRPQMWSSLFAVLLIGILEALKRDRPWSRWALPALMLLWSNMHGGFLYGDLLIATLLLGSALTRSGHPAFFKVGALAILVSGLNPNGFAAVSYVAALLPSAGGSASRSPIAEMQSIFGHVRSLWAIPRWFPCLSALMLVSAGSWLLLAGRSGRRRLDLLLPYLLVTVMGVRAIRFLIMYVPVAALVTAANVAGVLEAVRAGWFVRIRRAAPWAALGVLALGVWRLAPAGIRETAFGGGPAYRAPAEKAAAFVKSRGLRGNVFNEYSYGGYLIWALAPANRVFIDGRVLSSSAYERYRIAMEDPKRPGSTIRNGARVPAYREIFEANNIELVITPGCDPPSGRLLDLPVALIQDPAWTPVYADANSLVFALSTPANRSLVRELRVTPGAIGDHLLALASASGRDAHSRGLPFWRNTMAYAYFLKGDRPRAIAWLDEYIALSPQDENARRTRAFLQEALRP
jgi:hypothetical protein